MYSNLFNMDLQNVSNFLFFFRSTKYNFQKRDWKKKNRKKKHNYNWVMLMDALRAIVNKLPYEIFNTTFMRNIKSCQQHCRHRILYPLRLRASFPSDAEF